MRFELVRTQVHIATRPVDKRTLYLRRHGKPRYRWLCNNFPCTLVPNHCNSVATGEELTEATMEESRESTTTEVLTETTTEESRESTTTEDPWVTEVTTEEAEELEPEVDYIRFHK